MECDKQLTVDREVAFTVSVDVCLPLRQLRISESCLSQPAWTTNDYNEENRTEFNCTRAVNLKPQ